MLRPTEGLSRRSAAVVLVLLAMLIVRWLFGREASVASVATLVALLVLPWLAVGFSAGWSRR